jgi:hypothetical protein
VSALLSFSFTTFGAPSTKSLLSFNPNPVAALTSLITLILSAALNDSNFTVNVVGAAGAAGAASAGLEAAAGAAAGAAAEGAPAPNETCGTPL